MVRIKDPVPRLVSAVFSPFAVTSYIAIFLTLFQGLSLADMMIYISMMSVIPGISIVYGWLLGYVKYVDVADRIKRRVFYVTTMIPQAIFIAIDPPGILHSLAVSFFTMTLLCFIINLKWKISYHLSGFTCATVLLILYVNPGFVALYPIALLIAYSRLKMRMHNKAQITAGAILGSLVPLVIAWL
ncbi:MAG TPA: hypothetical protein VJH90_02880 [archaeon]|nr:hypothetical protein [archaeon]